MKKSSYMTRALRAHDPRYAHILGNLGYERADIRAAQPLRDPLDHDGDGRKGGSQKFDPSGDLKALRAEYQAAVGKRPFNGWDADTLKAKIAESKG